MITLDFDYNSETSKDPSSILGETFQILFVPGLKDFFFAILDPLIPSEDGGKEWAVILLVPFFWSKLAGLGDMGKQKSNYPRIGVTFKNEGMAGSTVSTLYRYINNYLST